MALKFDTSKKIPFYQIVLICMLFLISGGCDNEKDIFTIGIVAWDTQSGSIHLDGFRAGMAARNYVEGQNVAYIYESIPKNNLYDIQLIDAKLEKVLEQDLDLLLVIGQEVTVRAMELVKTTPVIFGGTARPLESGFVKSLGHPGGNMTGVRFANSVPKAFEWMVAICGVKKVYLPYNPDDKVSVDALEGLEEISNQLGTELVLAKIYSVEKAAVAIENLPEGIDAVYRIPSPTFDTENSNLSQAAIKRRLPMISPIQLDEAVLATFGNDEYNVGEKLARLAQQIDQGAKPEDLPVETSEVFLTINVDTAEKIGLQLPDEILSQAKKIIR